MFQAYSAGSIARSAGLSRSLVTRIASGAIDPTKDVRNALLSTWRSRNYRVLWKAGFSARDSFRWSGRPSTEVASAADNMYQYASILGGVHGRDPRAILEGLRRSKRYGYEDWEFYIESRYGIQV